jgi:predicted YcjX-like family ATPase
MPSLTRLTDDLTRALDRSAATISEAFFEPVLRLGVTGLARAGKTVFITSLVANLLDPRRMGQLTPFEAAHLQPQPDLTLPRFDFETHLAALSGPAPHWPESTRAMSQLRLTLRLHGGLWGARKLHLDILDYPGEWLLDLALMDQDYAQWSQGALRRLERWGATYDGPDPEAAFDETVAQALAARFTQALHSARAQGWSGCTPGRFLLPGDLAGAPVLTFAPLPGRGGDRGTLWAEMARRYEGYKREVVRPFFETHFARLDRQVVLVDLLDALHRGPAAIEDLRETMAQVLGTFRPGGNGFLSTLWHGRRIERVLIAATKADHLHHSRHDALGALAQGMVGDARARAQVAGAEVATMALAALRCTTEIERAGRGLVQGRLGDGRQAGFDPGALPDDPGALLASARQGTAVWPDPPFGAGFGTVSFQPAPLPSGGGLPHIRMDRAAQFLFGDRLG